MVLTVFLIQSTFLNPQASSNNEFELIEELNYKISEDEAIKIAASFKEDMIKSKTTLWSDDTQFIKILSLYNVNNDLISAYCIELSNGYILISAYKDVQNMILEWSDESEPLYYNFDIKDHDIIYYAGSIYYYKKINDHMIETLEHDIIEKEEAENVLSQIRNECYLCGQSSGSSSDISNASTHANNNYNGPFTVTTSVNYWNSYASFKTTSDFANLDGGYSNYC